MEQFSWFDIITLGLILILAIKGIFNGFIKEVFGLLGIIGGIHFGLTYAQVVGNYIDTNLFVISNKSALFIVGLLTTLIAFWLFCIFLGYIFSKMISLSGQGILNSLAGFIVGGAKIFLIFSIIFAILSNVVFVQNWFNKFLNNSFMYPIFVETGTYIINIKPNKLMPNEKNSTIKSIMPEKIEITTDENVEQNVSDKNKTTQ